MINMNPDVMCTSGWSTKKENQDTNNMLCSHHYAKKDTNNMLCSHHNAKK